MIVKHERLADAETLVLDYLKSNPFITNSLARSITGIQDANKMKRVFYRLRDKKLLEIAPGKKSSVSKWQLINNGDITNDTGITNNQLSLFDCFNEVTP